MGLGKTSSVLAYSGRAARARAESTRTWLSTTAQSRTRTSAGRPSVLYIDRGVIVLNKSPGLVAQGTSSAAPIAAKSHLPETTQPRTAFDDVLQGTAKTCSITFAPIRTMVWNVSALTTRRLNCSLHSGLRRAYGLSTNPYQVHRLDKVRYGHSKGTIPFRVLVNSVFFIYFNFIFFIFGGFHCIAAGNYRRSASRAYKGLGTGTLSAISCPCY